MPTLPTQIVPGHYEAEGKAFLDYAKRYVINAADFVSNAYRIPVDAGVDVLAVRARVGLAFDGTSPTVKVGDAADDDGFLLTTDLALATLNARANSEGKFTESAGVVTMNAYAQGKHFASAGFVLLTLAGTGITVGQLVVEVLCGGYGGGADRGTVKNLS